MKVKTDLAILISQYLDKELSMTFHMFKMHMNSHFTQHSHLKYDGFVSSTK